MYLCASLGTSPRKGTHLAMQHFKFAYTNTHESTHFACYVLEYVMLVVIVQKHTPPTPKRGAFYDIVCRKAGSYSYPVFAYV